MQPDDNFKFNILMELYSLSEGVLLDDGAPCERDGECRSICCDSLQCSEKTLCQGTRFGLAVIVVIACASVVIASLAIYCIYRRTRRNARYNSRLESINQPLKLQNSSASNNQINEEDMEDFTSHADDKYSILMRTQS